MTEWQPISTAPYDGVTLRWLTPIRAHSVWASLYDALAIHGHPEYGTIIEWHDGKIPKEWQDQIDAYNNTRNK